jgi:hypothetical protein
MQARAIHRGRDKSAAMPAILAPVEGDVVSAEECVMAVLRIPSPGTGILGNLALAGPDQAS